MPKSKGRRRTAGRPRPPAPLPKKKVKGPSPKWYVLTMFGLMGVGALLIILNYLAVIPGSPRNAYLFSGLAGIAAGFAMTTNYR